MKLVFLRWQIEYGEGERSSPVAEENRKTSISSGGDSWSATAGNRRKQGE